ncbi:MAG: ribonuclease P protein component, partial [Bacteroidales bacterium]|nr:ribonuclease P protein component [Bacteroidales bacterium]
MIRPGMKADREPVATRNTLGAALRIKGSEQSGLLFSQGRSFFVHPFKVFYLAYRHDGPRPYKVLFAVSRRTLRHAVDRNLIKRRMREAYRQNQHLLAHPEKMEQEKYLLGLLYVG